MTKTFEEELKDREAETFSHWDGCTISKKEFINYADIVNLSQGWVSPEEYEKLVKNCAVYVLECKNINRVNAQLTKENEDLKSQLQQQALPVVPECVAEIIEYAKNNKKSIRWFFTEDAYMFPEGMDWYAGSDKGLVDDIYAERQCSLINAFITGKYQVEKPQLFYLKNKLTTSYLALDTNTGYYEHWGEEIIPKLLNKQGYKSSFTQQEIDSMQTGSYEQIEVEK